MLEGIIIGECFSAGLALKLIASENPQRKHFCTRICVLVISSAVWTVKFIGCFVSRELNTLLVVYFVARLALTHLFDYGEADRANKFVRGWQRFDNHILGQLVLDI